MRLLPFLLFLFATISLPGQSKIIQALETEENLLTDYHFYPSTLRMINVNRDPAFDALVRPIRKIDFLSLRYERFDVAMIKQTVDRMIEEEGYETYADMSGPENVAFVLGKPAKDYTCILARMDSSVYVTEVQGKIDVMKLADVYNALMNRDSTMDNGFIDVFGIIQNGDEDQLKREARQREREEYWRKKEEEEKLKQDSLDALDPKEIIETKQ